jgi:hypothetical protein
MDVARLVPEDDEPEEVGLEIGTEPAELPAGADDEPAAES